MRLILIVILNVLYALDQWPRKWLGTLSPQPFKALLSKFMVWQDKQNRRLILFLIRRYGWIDRSRYGERAAKTAFLVIQHSPCADMERHFPLLRDAVCRGEAEARHLALMIDRLLMYRGKKQIYGTQFTLPLGGGTFTAHPIVNPKNVDARREKMGFTNSFAEYETMMNEMHKN